jgi:hypothetical protein
MGTEDLMRIIIWGMTFYGFVVIARGAKKALSSSPEIGDAAKKAATAKAISMIGKWLK